MTKYKPPDQPISVKGKPRVDAKCTGCGREGKSQFPDHYLCTVCYHERHARACERKVEQLKERIAKIEREAVYHRGMADAYSRRWYGKPSDIEGERPTESPSKLT